MTYKRILKHGIAIAAALILLALGTEPLEAAGGVFVYSEHVTDAYSFGSEKSGLMSMSGEVVLPAEHDNVYRLGTDDEGAPPLYVVSDAGDNPDDWYDNALYDVTGKKMTARPYGGFTWLRAGYVAATRRENNRSVVDILDKTGKVLNEALPVDYIAEGPNGFVGQTSRDDGSIDAFFYDKNWNEIKKLRVDGLYTYGPPVGGKWLLPYREGEKWGFLDDRGEVAIKPAYDYASSFEAGGYAMVDKDAKSGLIGLDGKEPLPFMQGYYMMVGDKFIVGNDGESAALLRASDLKELAPRGVYATFLTYYDDEGNGGSWTAGSRLGGGYDLFSATGEKIELPDASYVTLGEGLAVVSRGEDYVSAQNTLLNLATGAETPIGTGYGWFAGKDRLIMNDADGYRLYDTSGKEIAAYFTISHMYGTDHFLIQQRRFGQLRSGVIGKDGGILLEPVFSILNFDWESGVLAARKGTEEGYITLDGVWIYRHSAYNRLED